LAGPKNAFLQDEFWLISEDQDGDTSLASAKALGHKIELQSIGYDESAQFDSKKTLKGDIVVIGGGASAGISVNYIENEVVYLNAIQGNEHV
jgi:hypothetical protein